MVEADQYTKDSNQIWQNAWMGIHRNIMDTKTNQTPWIPDAESPIEFSLRLSESEHEQSHLRTIDLMMRGEEIEPMVISVIESNVITDSDGVRVEEIGVVRELVSGIVTTLRNDYVPYGNYCHPNSSGDLPKAYRWDQLPDKYNMRKQIDDMKASFSEK